MKRIGANLENTKYSDFYVKDFSRFVSPHKPFSCLVPRLVCISSKLVEILDSETIKSKFVSFE